MFESNKRFNKDMSELDNLSIRLNYMGGKTAESRFQTDKLRTLKKALLYSYQGATAVLEDDREFRCLINSDKLKNDYDNKILSIPFEDICLNSEFLGIPTSLAVQPTNVQVGDVFKWKETDTYWMVYLRYLEEDAYFRAEIRRCSSIATVNGKDYHVYLRGPIETTIRWNQKSNIVWNNINYSAIIYIKQDEDTNSLKRFDIIKIDGQNYEVQVVNRYTSGGILIVYLNEYYSNSIREENLEEGEEILISDIQGKVKVSPFDITSYSIDQNGGKWSLSNDKARILEESESDVTIEIVTGKSGEVELYYTKPSGLVFSLPITIDSF